MVKSIQMKKFVYLKKGYKFRKILTNTAQKTVQGEHLLNGQAPIGTISHHNTISPVKSFAIHNNRVCQFCGHNSSDFLLLFPEIFCSVQPNPQHWSVWRGGVWLSGQFQLHSPRLCNCLDHLPSENHVESDLQQQREKYPESNNWQNCVSQTYLKQKL